MPTTLHLHRTPAPSAPIVVDLPAVVSDEWVRDLVARISAATDPPPSAPAALPIAGTVGTGPLWMDLDRLSVVLHGREISLRRQEFLLLRAFLEHPDRALTRRQLLRLAWDDDGNGARTVDVHVRRLRVRLGCESRRLQTVRGHGYRFVSRATGVLAAVG